MYFILGKYEGLWGGRCVCLEFINFVLGMCYIVVDLFFVRWDWKCLFLKMVERLVEVFCLGIGKVLSFIGVLFYVVLRGFVLFLCGWWGKVVSVVEGNLVGEGSCEFF